MTGFSLIVVLIMVAYFLGFKDGRSGRPPEPLKGNYPHTEEIENANEDDYV